MNSMIAGEAASAAQRDGILPPEALPEPVSQGKLVLRKFLRHKLAMISTVILILIVLIAVIMPIFWTHKYEDASFPSFAAPTPDFPLGTTQVGKDMVSQVLRGTQFSLLIAIVVSIVATLIGVIFGSLAGYLRGFTDSSLSRLTDLFLIIPQIAAAAILAKVFGHGNWYVVAIVLALFAWMPIARITRAEAMALAQREFVEAARAAGASTRRIIFRHLVPNMVGSITVNATLAVAQAVLVEAALSFIGLGVSADEVSWGSELTEARDYIGTAWWMVAFPGAALVLTILSLNLIGDGLRDLLDPRQARR
jgi:peptide/nickel transport system permease protein